MGFYEDLKANETKIRDEWTQLWAAAGAGAIDAAQAKRTLEVLFQRSHLDILAHMPGVAKYFPTQQKYDGRLAKVKELWWVDHSTAGINGWGTLEWFSNEPRAHNLAFDKQDEAEWYAKKKGGTVTTSGGKYVANWKGYAGASTHFINFTDGTPFMIIPLSDGCWGEPKRNGDGIHIEQVNALVINPKNNTWYFWAGQLPAAILQVQVPVTLDKPFRGAKYMLPYTWEQVISNIKLKRICVAATEGRMALERMSQHTDWRESKFDMGPLWPFTTANAVAFETYDIESYGFMRDYVRSPSSDAIVDLSEVQALIDQAADPAIDNQNDADTTIDSTKEVQNALIKLYGPKVLPKYGADGHAGAETTHAVKQFQADWTKSHAQDRIDIDGIPGVQTCARLAKALAGDPAFKVS